MEIMRTALPCRLRPRVRTEGTLIPTRMVNPAPTTTRTLHENMRTRDAKMRTGRSFHGIPRFLWEGKELESVCVRGAFVFVFNPECFFLC